jgi:hypothetical protein
MYLVRGLECAIIVQTGHRNFVALHGWPSAHSLCTGQHVGDNAWTDVDGSECFVCVTPGESSPSSTAEVLSTFRTGCTQQTTPVAGLQLVFLNPICVSVIECEAPVVDEGVLSF